ncbi:hypothetical protein GCM10009661_66630 [Catellatospora chokoriensis]|uniref:Uncharacterized protein n=1 Tax=Catellatospora chokoriensis TaxID=310353 RepID=A0A8J3JT83_9ACTN|nr:hypothetical protein Cch02nite_40910 [Catellatospora chokoriensis]
MTVRTLLVLAVSAGAGVALGAATSVEVGFFGGLGVASLLDTLVEPARTRPAKAQPQDPP